MDSTRGCSEAECDRTHYGRGWCKFHYQRHYLGGTLETSPRTLVAHGASLEERLRHTGWTVTPNGCWEWNGSRNVRGYGQLAIGQHDGRAWRPAAAHRISYRVFNGDPTGMVVRHKCDNPPCINPAHLELGTKADNSADMSTRKRNATGEFHVGSVLTEAQVEEIRARYAAKDANQYVLAAEYGCSQQLVSLLVRGLRRTTQARPGAARS